MTLATESNLREAKLRRRREKDNRAATRVSGKGNTSKGYIRRGTAISPYTKENKFS